MQNCFSAHPASNLGWPRHFRLIITGCGRQASGNGKKFSIKSAISVAKLDWIDVIMSTYNFQEMQNPEIQKAIEQCNDAGKRQDGGLTDSAARLYKSLSIAFAMRFNFVIS